jgi:fatty acid desaturase
LLLCLAVGYSMGLVYLSSAPLSLAGTAAFIVCSFALFRAGIFVHEITHMRDAQMRGFQVGWNLLCGIPMMMPSHFYTSHIDHHNTQHFGTPHDGEYLPLASGKLGEIGWFFAQTVWMPALIAVRLLVSPLTFVHPRVRRFALERWSSYVINFQHRLDVRPGAHRRAWAALELACSLRIALPIAIVAFGVWPWSRLLLMYVLACFVLGLNYIRNLVSHRYRNDGQPMTHAEQLADSTTIANRNLLTGLFFPVGLRYHALHHLFPGIPYHNLGRAHRRLVEQLPPDAVYRQTIFPGYWAAVRDLLANVRKHEAQRRAACAAAA